MQDQSCLSFTQAALLLFVIKKMISCYISELIIPVGPTSGNVNSTFVSANWGVHALLQIWDPALWIGEVKCVLEGRRYNELSHHGRSRDLPLTLRIAFAPALLPDTKKKTQVGQQPKAKASRQAGYKEI